MENGEIKKYDDATTKNALEALTKKYFGKPASFSSLGGGSFGRAYKVKFAGGGNAVIKLFFKAGMQHEQAEATAALAKRCPIPMPKTLFVHDSDAEIPVEAMGMEFMSGTVAVYILPYFRSRKKRRHTAEAIADAMYEIHKTKNDNFGALSNPVYEKWTDYYKPFAANIAEWVKENGAKPEHSINAAMRTLFAESFEKFDKIFAEPVGEPTLIHGDLNVANFMVDSRSLKPVAIIDPWGTMWADRDYDLFQLRNITGKGYYLYDTYKKKFEVSKTCDLKCAFYAFYNEVYCYMLSGINFSYSYPRLTRELKEQMKRFGI